MNGAHNHCELAAEVFRLRLALHRVAAHLMLLADADAANRDVQDARALAIREVARYANDAPVRPRPGKVLLIGGPRHGDYVDRPAQDDEPIETMTAGPVRFDADISFGTVFPMQRDLYHPRQLNLVPGETVTVWVHGEASTGHLYERLGTLVTAAVEAGRL